MEDGAAVFDGLTPPAFHAGEFWVGVCLKTKPPEGERGGETLSTRSMPMRTTGL